MFRRSTSLLAAALIALPLVAVPSIASADTTTTSVEAASVPQRTQFERIVEDAFLEEANEARWFGGTYNGPNTNQPPLLGITDLRDHARAWSDTQKRRGEDANMASDPTAEASLCCTHYFSHVVGRFSVATNPNADAVNHRARGIFHEWMAFSPEWRAAVLDARFEEVGVGVSIHVRPNNALQVRVTANFRNNSGGEGGQVYFTPKPQPETPSGGSGEPVVRSGNLACPLHPGAIPNAGFRDVPAQGSGYIQQVHRAVNCLAWWEVTSGRTATSFDPSGTVTRGQMATFIANTLRAMDFELPSSSNRFRDVTDGPHRANINALAAAGIIDGFGDRTFRPNARVTRAQMAKFLVEGYDAAADFPLDPPAGSWFKDVPSSSPHHANINRAAEAGFAAGRSAGTYDPNSPVTREHMALFLTRKLDLAVEEGVATRPS